jgi:hypothetical protein
MRTSNLSMISGLSPTLIEIFNRITKSGQVTPTDRNGLKEAMLVYSLSSDEEHLVNRLYYAMRRGWLTMIDHEE